MKKIIYFATGNHASIAADLRTHCAVRDVVLLRVIVPAPQASPFIDGLYIPTACLIRFRSFMAPLIWLRLIWFAGIFNQIEIICCTTQHQHRFLKLFAFTIRGRVTFVQAGGLRSSHSLIHLIWLEIRTALFPKGPVLLVGIAPHSLIREVLADLRRSQPKTEFHGLLSGHASELDGGFNFFMPMKTSSLGVYFQALRFGLRFPFSTVAVPWDSSGNLALKWLLWFLPVWHLYVYNENLDTSSARNPVFLLRHLTWRMLERRQKKEQKLRRLPVGFIGSTSSYYMKIILPSVRRQYPGAKMHAVLPQALETPTVGMFDSSIVIRPGVLPLLAVCCRLLWTRNRYQAWIVPLTNEPYREMKFLALFLPLPNRQLFNELGEGFSIGNRKLLWSHFLWRLRDRLSFQIVTAAAGPTRAARFAHLFAYAFRLLSGATLLARTLLRPVSKAPQPADAAIQAKPVRVDLFMLDGASNVPSESAGLLPKVNKESIHEERIPPLRPAVRSTEHGDYK